MRNIVLLAAALSALLMVSGCKTLGEFCPCCKWVNDQLQPTCAARPVKVAPPVKK